jgi:hypothetical protein
VLFLSHGAGRLLVVVPSLPSGYCSYAGRMLQALCLIGSW